MYFPAIRVPLPVSCSRFLSGTQLLFSMGRYQVDYNPATSGIRQSCTRYIFSNESTLPLVAFCLECLVFMRFISSGFVHNRVKN